jgi:hypothetical protein
VVINECLNAKLIFYELQNFDWLLIYLIIFKLSISNCSVVSEMPCRKVHYYRLEEWFVLRKSDGNLEINAIVQFLWLLENSNYDKFN